MHVRYELSPEDVVVFSKEAVKGTPQNQVLIVIFGMIGLVFMASDLIALFFAVFLNDGSIRVPDLGTTIFLKLLMWLVLIALIYITLMFLARRGVRKNAASHPGINGLYCEHLIELDEKGFTESTAVNKAFFAWSSVESVRETDNLVLITIRLGAIYFIQKRAFENDGHRRSFIAAANQYILTASMPPPPEFVPAK